MTDGRAASHPYPPAYASGTHWAIDEAWNLLDQLPVGQLTDDQRFLLAGQIAGSLMRVASNAAIARSETGPAETRNLRK